ncbi:aminomethyl-transferring glycine dehydrogenase [Candidatus Pelagibacter sp.]|nr:aminomethyl-transferring glycine dehydrogenase [Candidatus Pelagibacter sp.]MDA9813466.1 aminomethyl-transferring glycine dehydrogenase [Candidatus Pelagibacter sp.]MDC0647400.1 aminomethyl-transferring glycine dehydrogenase [Candidatus Pelagibacter sp.]MDC0915255.1 aminomethyl-transferring glycine dehydrogenase [Candidatus Pelagibacter sp.]MDC0961752.1 aminomethyl-transferring glycine dehydrogenase [Candidatus Pelagibacter sp.]
MLKSSQKDFIKRHIGPSEADQQKMLNELGFENLDDLISKTVPEKILLKEDLGIGEPNSEYEALRKLKVISKQNRIYSNFIGMGYYGTYTPYVILRNILENPGWYTSYTPYQPEVAQGRLEMLLNFQQMIIDFTGLDIANASLLDEGTAAAEAVGLSYRLCKNDSNIVFVSKDCHPQTIDVIKTRAEPLGLTVVVGDEGTDINEDIVCGILQYPGTLGDIKDPSEAISKIHKNNGKAVLVCDLLALAKLKTPAELGADIAVGSSQRFGIPMGYGGPHAGFFATKDEYKRSMPGRIIGVSVDRHGNKAYRLSLQTREQHIRRDKATSNICTAQALLAIVSAAYAIYHGPEGLRKIAENTSQLAKNFADKIKQSGYELYSDHFFDTVTIKTLDKTDSIFRNALRQNVNIRKVNSEMLSVAFDERKNVYRANQLLKIFNCSEAIKENLNENLSNLPKNLLRTSEYLTHPVFNSYHSETEMLRYLKKLEDADIALNRSMIALGSCTMKLNAVAEMIPVTWREFSEPHPFAPVEQMEGYRTLFTDLKNWLRSITGFSGVSLQPNAGAQGEFAGLMVIKKYHENNGDKNRNVCLIPSSAHGTNPASAQMVGMKVVVIKCDEHGNVDIEDLKEKATTHSENLAALMVTYPSTHGVFEEKITEICELIHNNGGQVYMDGANLNALVGIAKPGKFGPDVCHINLHKTFCIPHGGGGPGMGPIACKRHLEVYLPNHAVIKDCGPVTGMGAVSAAPWGSSSILSISWMYIKMMGSEGLKKASQVAILNANYLAHKLKDTFPILYKGKNGNVAHECIIDIRKIKSEVGITEEDIAKRLIDFGFHAPTMSWPVAGTMMIEPTESEGLQEIDRFCNTLKKIKEEIDKVQSGEYDKIDNPIKNSPHTHVELIANKWEHKYEREEAAYPSEFLKQIKYWPPVARVDNVYGDKNLVCSCPSIDEYKDTAA